MSRWGVAGALVAVAAAALGGGYWLGRQAPPPAPVAMPAPPVPPPAPVVAERPLLYYQDPTGLPDFSREPKKDALGRDYVPVYGEAEPPAAPVAAAAPATGKILYYRNPMGLPDTSMVPKKDPMGMDYVPVYEGEAGGSAVRVNPDKVQKLGVRTEPATLRRLTRTIRAVGSVQVDERRVRAVSAKFEGYIERLHVNTTGQAVKRGQSLMEVYSPALVLAQQEYLAAWSGYNALGESASPEARDSARRLAEGSLQRLRSADVSEGQIERLRRQGSMTRTLSFASPANGVVLEKRAVEGMRFMPGEELFRIADLANVWVIAEVFEQDLAALRLGQPANVSFNALPGMVFTGIVTFIYPTLSAETRTVKVRIELPNPEDRLKPALYATVDLPVPSSDKPVVAVPDSAVLDSGAKQVVLVERGEGLFEPREIKAGGRADGYVAVLDGLAEGERVVVKANFLIDAESNLRAALQGFQGGQSGSGHSGHGQ